MIIIIPQYIIWTERFISKTIIIIIRMHTTLVGIEGLLFVLQKCLCTLHYHISIPITYIIIIIIISACVFDEKKHWTVKFRILCFTMITIISRRLGVYIIRQRAESKRRQEADYAPVIAAGWRG